jgi:hypothetical protein
MNTIDWMDNERNSTYIERDNTMHDVKVVTLWEAIKIRASNMGLRAALLEGENDQDWFALYHEGDDEAIMYKQDLTELFFFICGYECAIKQPGIYNTNIPIIDTSDEYKEE